MSETCVPDQVVTRPSQPIPPIGENQAVATFLASFAAIKHLLAGYSPPARPKRNRPAVILDPQLREEIEAWEAASDQAFEKLENELPE